MSLDDFYQAIEDYVHEDDTEGIIDQIYANYFGYINDFKEPSR